MCCLLLMQGESWALCYRTPQARGTGQCSLPVLPSSCHSCPPGPPCCARSRWAQCLCTSLCLTACLYRVFGESNKAALTPSCEAVLGGERGAPGLVPVPPRWPAGAVPGCPVRAVPVPAAPRCCRGGVPGPAPPRPHARARRCHWPPQSHAGRWRGSRSSLHPSVPPSRRAPPSRAFPPSLRRAERWERPRSHHEHPQGLQHFGDRLPGGERRRAGLGAPGPLFPGVGVSLPCSSEAPPALSSVSPPLLALYRPHLCPNPPLRAGCPPTQAGSVPRALC